MKKRILFILDSIWSIGKNMGASSLYRLLKEADQEFDCTIITSPDDSDFHDFPNSNVITYGKVMRSKINRYIQFIISFINYFIINLSIYKRVAKTGKAFDLIYCSTSTPALATYFLARKYNVPVIIRLYGTFLYGKTEKFIENLKNWQEVLAFRIRANKFIITNDGTKGDAVAAHFNISKDRLWFARNGVDKLSVDVSKIREEMRREYGLSDEDFIIISVSRLVGWKRVDRTIKAVNQIKEDGIKFIIVGDGPMMNEYQQMSENKNILFLGAKTYNEVRQLMFASDLFISAYDISNIGNPLLEAMTSGLPIVTINTGDTSDVIDGNNGILIEYGSEPEMVDRIRNEILDLFNNAERRKMLSNSAKDYSDKNILGWDERINAEITIIKEIANEKSVSDNG